MLVTSRARWAYAFTFLLHCLATNAFAVAQDDCDGPYKGQQVTQEQLDEEVLPNHKAWLEAGRPDDDERRANLCGANLFQAELSGANLVEANLSGADLLRANLSGTNLRGANLRRAEFRLTNLSQATLTGANLSQTDLRGEDLSKANLYGTNFSEAILFEANLSYANLGKANLSNASLGRANLFLSKLPQANLNQANLEEADLRGTDLSESTLVGAILRGARLWGAKLVHVDLSLAEMDGADLTRVRFHPLPLKEVSGLRGVSGLSRISIEAVIPIVSLRQQFKEAGFKTEEKALTSALRKYQLERASVVERLFTAYILGGKITDFGADPSLAVITLFSLIPVFACFYFLALGRPGRDGIWQRWIPERSRTDLGHEEPVLLQKRGLRAVPYAFYFSLLSAFHIGWRELNIGNWISRIQPREYTLSGSGWVRTVSGIQSLLSVYLLAIAALSYFGRPFE